MLIEGFELKYSFHAQETYNLEPQVDFLQRKVVGDSPQLMSEHAGSQHGPSYPWQGHVEETW